MGRVLLQRWRVNRRGGGANGSWRGEGRMYRSPVGCGMGCGMGRGIGCVGVRVVDGGRVRVWAVDHTARVAAVRMRGVVGGGWVLERRWGVGSTLGERWRGE